MRQRTIKLSDRRTDVSKPETPRPNPTAQPGSLQRLVRQSNVHELKNLRPNSTQSQRRPALPLRQKCNRATHEYKSAPSCGTSPTVHRRKRRKQRGKLSLRSLRLLLFKTSEHDQLLRAERPSSPTATNRRLKQKPQGKPLAQ